MSALPHQPRDPTPADAPRPRPSRTPPPLKNFIFNPPEDHIDRILDRILDPQFSLTAIAFDYETTLPALNLWLARPDIDERLRAHESICARRTRLIAANALPFAVTTLTRILQEYNEDEYLNPGDTNSRENKRRWHETARKATHLLFRISTYDPARQARRVRTEAGVARAAWGGPPVVLHQHYTTTTTTDPSITFASPPDPLLSVPSIASVLSGPSPAHPEPAPDTAPSNPDSLLKSQISNPEIPPPSPPSPPPSPSTSPLAQFRQIGTSPGYGADLSGPSDPGTPHPITGHYPRAEDNAHLYPPIRERDHAAWVRIHGIPVHYYASQPDHPQHAAAVAHLAREAAALQRAAGSVGASPTNRPDPATSPDPTHPASAPDSTPPLKSQISNPEIPTATATPVPLTLSAHPKPAQRPPPPDNPPAPHARAP